MAKFLKLENVEETAKNNPDSFFIPTIEERKSKAVGESVRLHFHLDNPTENEPHAERMWVTVTKRPNLFRGYKGTLENMPAYIEDLKIGDEVVFKPCHIAQTIVKKDESMWIDCANQKALVSDMCFNEGECVRFLYREKADRAQDSGWRMFTGHESEEYNNDPNNIRVVDVSFMLDKDSSLLKPLKESVGAVYERSGIDVDWVKVTDWSPAE